MGGKSLWERFIQLQITKKNNENLPVMVVHVVEVAVVVVVYHHYPFGVNCCYQLHSFHRLLEAVAYLAVLLTHLLLSNGREKKEEKYRKYKYIYIIHEINGDFLVSEFGI